MLGARREFARCLIRLSGFPARTDNSPVPYVFSSSATVGE